MTVITTTDSMRVNQAAYPDHLAEARQQVENLVSRLADYEHTVNEHLKAVVGPALAGALGEPVERALQQVYELRGLLRSAEGDRNVAKERAQYARRQSLDSRRRTAELLHETAYMLAERYRRAGRAVPQQVESALAAAEQELEVLRHLDPEGDA